MGAVGTQGEVERLAKVWTQDVEGLAVASAAVVPADVSHLQCYLGRQHCQTGFVTLLKSVPLNLTLGW